MQIKTGEASITVEEIVSGMKHNTELNRQELDVDRYATIADKIRVSAIMGGHVEIQIYTNGEISVQLDMLGDDDYFQSRYEIKHTTAAPGRPWGKVLMKRKYAKRPAWIYGNTEDIQNG